MKRKGFMLFDALIGMALLAALASALAVAMHMHQRSSDRFAAQRQAIFIAQEILSSGKTTDSFAHFEIHRTGKRIGDHEWIEVTVTCDNATESLSGLSQGGPP